MTVDEKGLEAAARAFKRMHGNVCYPQASDGEATLAATEIITAYEAAKTAEGPAAASSDHTAGLIALVEGMERELAEAEVEAEHFARLACDDLGKNPPVFWKERALTAEAERDTYKLALVAEKEAAEAERDSLREALAALIDNIDTTGGTHGAMSDARRALTETRHDG